MGGALARLFKLRLGEALPTLTMFGMFFCVVGAFVIGRAVRDTLFLAAMPASRLAPVYVGQSVALAVVSSAYAIVAQRVRRGANGRARLIVVTPVVLGLSLLGARALLGSGHWILYVLYLWVEVIGTVSLLEFWSFANERYHARDAKRLFGLIAAGSTVATILVGLVVSGLAPRIGASNLLFLSAGLLLAAAALGSVAAKRLSGHHPSSLSPPPPGARLVKREEAMERRVLRAPHAIAIALVVLMTTLVVTLVDFQFKAIAGQTFGADRDALASYFGTFYSVSGGVALFVQLGITGRLLERFGVVGTLGVLPLLLLGGSAALFVHPLLWAATFAKGSDSVLRYTLNDAGMQLLYMPLAADARGRTKAFVEGLVKPGAQAIAGAGVLFWGATSAAIAPLSVGAILLTVVWILVLVRARGTYVDALRETLRTRRARLVGRDDELALSSYASVVEQTLRQEEDDEDLEHSIELAMSLPKDLLPAVIPLFEHPRAVVRKMACEYAVAHHAKPTRASDSNEARAARIERLVEARIDDVDADVRAAAIAGYCSLLGAEGLPRVMQQLERMRHDGDRVRREQAATALGVPDPRFAELLLPMLADRDGGVRRAAIASAAKIGSAELVAPLVRALGDPAIARDAASALSRFDRASHVTSHVTSHIEEALGELLADPRKPLGREHVPSILGRLATPKAIELLTAALESKEEALRRAAAQSLARASTSTSTSTERPRGSDGDAESLPIDRERLTRACSKEIALAYRAIAAAEAIEPNVRFTHHGASQLPNVGDGGAAAALLVSALLEQREGAQDRAFAIVQVLFPASDAVALREGMKERDAIRHANAIEILDSTLDGPIRQQLLPLLDDSHRLEKLAAGARFFDLPAFDSPEEWIARLLDDDCPWVAACAAHYIGASATHSPASFVPRLREIVEQRSAAPIVRESALAALEELCGAKEIGELARRLLADDSAASFAPLVRRAEHIHARADRGDDANGNAKEIAS
ncbi:MAG: HEAT repeat domain-containing protein [Labilithrix sp.]|nr:HEAT repeat domain-containing protein [Labilithrix sp.]MCW5811464.1 HEAT repeat domain-containing protein [Labilithrix sp.]